MCNMIEWGPVPWLEGDIAATRHRLAMCALMKTIADIFDMFIEHHESGNTARYLAEDIGTVLAVRDWIMSDGTWPHRSYLVDTEMYGFLGERHTYAVRLANQSTQTRRQRSVHATSGGDSAAWNHMLSTLDCCSLHGQDGQAARRLAAGQPDQAEGQDYSARWDAESVINAVREWLGRVVKTDCPSNCADFATEAVHRGIVSSGAFDRVLAVNGYGAGPAARSQEDQSDKA
ncbi:hypothetical protein ACIQWR_41445 [Streptomyces sp. NPDC098789]|uniref:hypothetical protein n=1 Tax=Streptomyces sp. NPDC098789 TaxID=3366098 RepID=UPI00381FB9BB